ncbi:hypothetical protein D9M71_724660 [compost metagenome]
MQRTAITWQAKQALHYRAGVVQVSQGLEQRYHAHGAQHAGFLEQQLHCQHIGGGTRHGDDIRAQRRRWRRCDLAAGG